MRRRSSYNTATFGDHNPYRSDNHSCIHSDTETICIAICIHNCNHSGSDNLIITVIQLIGLLTGLGLLELQHFIYSKLLTVFGMLAFSTNLGLKEFQVRYLTLFCLFFVIDGLALFWAAGFHKNTGLMLALIKAPLLVLHISYYTLRTFMTLLSVMLLSTLMILVSTLSASAPCQ